MRWKWAPVHERLTASTAKRELALLNLTLDELPLIRLSDPAIKLCVEEGQKIEVGDVIRITRNSKVGGEGYRYYRRVIL